MPRLLPLEPYREEGQLVNFLVDTHTRRYIRLEGMNSDQTVLTVLAFLTKYAIFSTEGDVMRRDRLPDYRPLDCSDYSPVMVFYDLILRSQNKKYAEEREKVEREREPFVHTPELLSVRQSLRSVLSVPPPEDDPMPSPESSEESESSLHSVGGVTGIALDEIGEDADSSSDETASETEEPSASETEESSSSEPTPPPKRKKGKRRDSPPPAKVSGSSKSTKKRKEKETTTKSKGKSTKRSRK